MLYKVGVYLSTRVRQVLVIFFFLTSLVILITVVLERQIIRQNASSTTKRWPLIEMQAGPYSIAPKNTPEKLNEITDASQAGLKLFRFSSSRVNGTPSLKQLLETNNLRYIDTSLWSFINTTCGPQNRACDLDNTNDSTLKQMGDSILANITTYLNRDDIKNDPLIIGFWVQDDNHGHIKEFLKKVHMLIAEHNKTSVVRRPSVCAYGGQLDYKNALTDTSFSQKDDSFTSAVENFSPEGCDIVALYPYGYSYVNDERAVDWTMERVLPFMLNLLKEKGWSADQIPLMAVPQVSGYTWKPDIQVGRQVVHSTYQSVLTQTEAYCKNGATSVLFYAWDDTSEDPGKQQAFNNEDMRRGILDGIEKCRTSWGSTNSLPAEARTSDINKDTLVDRQDFEIWKCEAIYATTQECLSPRIQTSANNKNLADIDGNGSIDLLDYSLWRTYASGL